MKRKPDDSPEASGSKMPRRDGDNSLNEGGETSQWEQRPGMILEVKMRNFMCHQTFTFNPNQRLTFLSGENGSGKSAVLTAIVFALGGSARVASRGSTNKAFIRTDQTSAIVEVRLANVGEAAYKPEVYGRSIRIERRVTNTSSAYRIMDDKGKVVVEKKHKEELERILMAFNIQVDNPIAVLNQDTAKTFLFKCDPDKLYTFFMRATQLEACKNDYNEANIQREHTEGLVQEKKNSLPALQKEAAKWEKKHQFHTTLTTKKKDILRKKGEMAWGRVRDLEEVANKLKDEAEKEKQKIGKAEEKVMEEVEREKELIKNKRVFEKEIQEIAQSEQKDQKRQEELLSNYKIKAKKSKELQDQVIEMDRRKTSIQKEIKVLESEITKLRTSGTEEYDREHKKRMAAIRKLEEDTNNLQAEISTSENHLRHLQANERSANQKIMDIKARKVREAGATASIQKEITNLSRAGRNKLGAFGDYMQNLDNEIKRNKRFRQKPIGPLGAFIKLKEGTSQDIQKCLENETSGIMTSFLVSCNEDRQELFSIFSRLRIDRKPTVYTCAFTNQRHDVSRHRVYSDKFHVLIDYLDIEDVNVYNRVVDACHLERIILIPTQREAQAALSRTDEVPRNTLYAVVEQSYQYYPAPNYRSYFYPVKSTGLLQASVEQYIEQQREKLVQAQNRERELEAEIRAANEEKMAHTKEVDACNIKLRNLIAKVRQANNQIMGIKTQDEAEQPPDVSALEDDLEKRNENLKATFEFLETRKSTLEDANIETGAAKEALKRFKDEIQSRTESAEPLNQKLLKLEYEISRCKKNKEYYSNKKGSYKENIQALEAEVAKKEDELVDITSKAMNFARERIETRNKVEKLAKEIKAAEDLLRQQEQTSESRQVVTDNHIKYSSALAKASSQIKYMDNTVAFLSEMLEVRKKGYKEIRSATCKNINVNFTTQLAVRKYIGKLTFNHKDSSLTICVNPNVKDNAAALDIDRDIRSLSGGEKSYSSVSLILALWESMSPPFRILDEFDVFMDSVNRKIAISNILNFARVGRKFQFVFLTPLGTENIDTEDGDVKIIKLSKIGN